MAGGQAIDLAHVGRRDDAARPVVHASHEDRRAHPRVDPARRGVRPALSTATRKPRSTRYARAAGLAFQVVDDVLDVEGSVDSLGKTAGKDAAQNKPTYVTLLGLAEAKRHARGVARRGARRARPVRRARAEARRARGLDHADGRTDVPIARKHRQPADLRKLDRSNLRDLARELRAFLLYSVAKTGGHLSSNLGTVELTVALHYVFDTPHDRIVWDVGHQTYAHKILTGRREAMAQAAPVGRAVRLPAPRASREYDTFGTAHSSTSISAALGMAVAAKLKRRGPARRRRDRRRRDERRHGVRGAQQRARAPNLLVILNDNEMSISEPVGAFNKYLAKILSRRLYNTVRRGGKEVLAKLPADARPREGAGGAHEGHGAARHAVRGVRLQLHRPDRRPRPRHARAERSPTCATFQGRSSCTSSPRRDTAIPRPRKTRSSITVSASSTRRSASRRSPPAKPTYTQVFGDWLCDMAATDPRVVGITPAMREGSGLVRFSQEYPDALLRRRHRRAARGHVRRGPRVRRHEAGGRDLLDVPAARLRPARSTTSRCRTCRSCSRSTAPVSSAPTARRTSAPSISRTCAACRTRR